MARRMNSTQEGGKYNAFRVTIGDRTFASRSEATYFLMLLKRKKRGELLNLKTQVTYELHAKGGKKVCRFILDFTYTERESGRFVVADVKGFRHPVYRLKAKWFKAEYGIDVEEVRISKAQIKEYLHPYLAIHHG